MIQEIIEEINAEVFLHLTIKEDESQLETQEVETETKEVETEVDEPKAETEVDEPKAETEVDEPKAETEVDEPNVETEVDEPKVETDVDEPKVETETKEVDEPKVETEVDEAKEEQDMIDDENRIMSEQQVAFSTLPEDELESQSETDSDDDIPYGQTESDMSKLYLVSINNQNRFIVNTKSQARDIVAKKVKELVEYYSADNSVYKVFVSIKDNTYTISGYYKFMTIQCETVFETLKIEEIEKLN